MQGSSVYNYVYQYKDHLGNIRMNYAVVPGTGVLTVKEENHYYPFGLKHQNYNTAHLHFRELNARVRLLGKEEPPIALDPFMKAVYNYKYNGKETQDEPSLFC